MLIGLLALGAAPSFGKDALQDLSTSLVPDAVPFAIGEEPSAGGPVRDPAGDDWIFYDDGTGPSYYPSLRLYARVIFTPSTEFQLQAISVCPGNWNNSNAPFNVYVFRENQQSHNLGEQVYTARLNALPEWQADMASNWQLFEFEEEEYVHFDSAESFSVIYGLCPGGDQNQQGTGYWAIVDGASEVRRSYLAQVAQGAAPPVNHAQAWQGNRLNNDLLIRANGTYLSEFVDVAVVEVFNGNPNQALTGQYLMYPNTQQTFKAQIANIGNDVDVMTLNFSANDLEGNVLWNYDQVVENLGGGDTVVVTCDEAWSHDTPGTYRIFVSAEAGDDSNYDNDINSLDQIIFDPENGRDTWIGYTDTTMETSTSGAAGDIGWGAVFNHPGGADRLLWVTGYQCMVQPADENEYPITFLVAKIDLAARQLETLIDDTLYTDNTGIVQWVGRDLDREEYITFGENEAILVTYIAADGTRIQIDGTPPISGTNAHMPSSMMITFDGGNGYSGANSGDYAIQVKLGVSEDLPEGKHFKLVPDTLDFGEVRAGRDHEIMAMFIGTGMDSVHVTNVQIPPSARNFVRISQQQFSLASAETTFVTVTFRADVDTAISTQLLVNSDSDDNRQLRWRLIAHATLSIHENVQTGIPGEYSLSQNYPNPFNPTTSIGFALPKADDVHFGVYDMNGRLVSDLFNGRLGAGYHSFEFDATDLPAGIYSYKLSTSGFTSVRKMVLMK